MKKVIQLFGISIFMLLMACEEEPPVADELGNIVLTAVDMTNQTDGQTVHLSWVYAGVTTQLSHFRIEYSLQHGPWVAAGNAANTETNITLTFPAATLLSNNYYDWRVVAVNPTEEVASCYKEDIMEANATFGRLQLHTSHFTTNSLLEFDYDFSSIGLAVVQQAGIHPVVQKKEGADWVEVVDYFATSFARTERFSIPMDFEEGETYRVYLHGAESYYGKGNTIEFTYVNPYSNACCGDMATVEAPQITTVSIGNSMAYRNMNLTWTHPNPAALTGFKIQYSAQHGPWIDFRTVDNQTLSLGYSFENGNAIPYSVFQSNCYYRWRVIALTDNLQVPSCTKTTKTEMGNFERNGLGIYLSVEQDANTPTFKAVPSPLTTTLAGVTYTLSRFDGSQWVAQTPIDVGTITQAGGTFTPTVIAGERYRISARATNGASSNYIEFYANEWPFNPGGC